MICWEQSGFSLGRTPLKHSRNLPFGTITSITRLPHSKRLNTTFAMQLLSCRNLLNPLKTVASASFSLRLDFQFISMIRLRTLYSAASTLPQLIQSKPGSRGLSLERQRRSKKQSGRSRPESKGGCYSQRNRNHFSSKKTSISWSRTYLDGHSSST